MALVKDGGFRAEQRVQPVGSLGEKEIQPEFGRGFLVGFALGNEHGTVPVGTRIHFELRFRLELDPPQKARGYEYQIAQVLGPHPAHRIGEQDDLVAMLDALDLEALMQQRQLVVVHHRGGEMVAVERRLERQRVIPLEPGNQDAGPFAQDSGAVHPGDAAHGIRGIL